MKLSIQGRQVLETIGAIHYSRKELVRMKESLQLKVGVPVREEVGLVEQISQVQQLSKTFRILGR